MPFPYIPVPVGPPLGRSMAPWDEEEGPSVTEWLLDHKPPPCKHCGGRTAATGDVDGDMAEFACAEFQCPRESDDALDDCPPACKGIADGCRHCRATWLDISGRESAEDRGDRLYHEGRSRF